jgi:hypothetical protein
MKHGVGLLLMMALSASAMAQAGTEEQALLEMFFAKDAKTVEAHFPEQVREELKKLSPIDRAKFEQTVLVRGSVCGEGKCSTPEDGHALIAMELTLGDERVTREVRLHRKISNGRESLLDLESAEGYGGGLQIWMILENEVWRLTEISLSGRQRFTIDEAFVERFRDTARKDAEQDAVSAMLEIYSAVSSYSYRHRDLGVPINLDELRVEPPALDGDEPAYRPEVEPDLLKGRKGRYTFEYARTSRDGFVITGRPASYDAMTKRSFWMDSHGTIRFTEENRVATAEDTVLH